MLSCRYCLCHIRCHGVSKMGSDLEQWKHCLIKSIQLFCRNFCQYSQEAKIDGLLAITLDQKEVILVKLQEVDNDTSPQTSASEAAADQSELLESILRFLAPSCRLLKKTPIAPTLPSVWQPVSDRSGEIPDRFTFLRSLGLAPTALVSNRKMEMSYASRLRTRSSRRMMRSIPPFSYCPMSISPKVSDSSREVNSEPPTLSPCPNREVPSLARSEYSEPSDDGAPLPKLKRCVSDEEQKDSTQESPKSDCVRSSQPLTVDCNKNSADLNGISHRAHLLTSKPASLLQMVNSVSCVGRDNASTSKKSSPTSTPKDATNSCGDAHEKKPVQRPKKRSQGHAVSPALPGESQPESYTSAHSASVKRVKTEPGEITANGKTENDTLSVGAKPEVSRSKKKVGKVKEGTGNIKLKTEAAAGSSARLVKTAVSVSSKKMSSKSPVATKSQKDMKIARKKLLSRTKVC